MALDPNGLKIAKNAFLTSTKWGMSEKYSIEVIKDILNYS